MREMDWDEDVWRALRDAITPMPPFVRRTALKIIIEASEDFARERGSDLVQEEDLVRAGREKVPAMARRQMLRALMEAGIEVE